MTIVSCKRSKTGQQKFIHHLLVNRQQCLPQANLIDRHALLRTFEVRQVAAVVQAQEAAYHTENATLCTH